MVTVHAATPGEIRSRGAGLTIRHGIHATPFGDCFIALTDKGISALEFVANRETMIDALQAQWPKASFQRAPKETAAVVARLFQDAHSVSAPLSVYVKGTNFQVRVWEALLRIPSGALVTYENVAEFIGDSRALRAVASAIARNPVALLIPCHRVIRKTGALGGYRWGETRKHALLAWEAAHYAVDDTAASMSARQRA
jgi:AraC family transcriptional regulator of adaptative response/methylated-DNA-[protein]-cysteine methyltransferase